MRRLALCLLHFPVCDREGRTVTAAITNIDLHDLSRSALTYGVSDVFVVHPVEAQRELALRIRQHWVEGSGARRIPDRKPALELLRVMPDLEAALNALGPDTEIWTTSAVPLGRTLSFPAARERLAQEGAPVMLCLGTAWGLSAVVHERASQRLAPILSPAAHGYNHLSVRAAAAITLDRLLGD